MTISDKKIELGKEIAELREAKGANTYTTFRELNIPYHTIKSVVCGNKNYAIDTLLKLLQEVGKTIKIINL